MVKFQAAELLWRGLQPRYFILLSLVIPEYAQLVHMLCTEMSVAFISRLVFVCREAYHKVWLN